jgi:uncharacterized membrane protein
MSTLFVLKVENQNTAEQMVNTMKQLQSQHLIEIDDAAIITREMNGKPKIKQLHDLVGTGALGGAFWGLLFGMLFFMPFVGAAIGAASGAIAGKFADIGIDDNFIKNVGEQLQPGQTALFALTKNAVPDKVLDALKSYKFQIIQTSLPKEKEVELREMLGQHQHSM